MSETNCLNRVSHVLSERFQLESTLKWSKLWPLVAMRSLSAKCDRSLRDANRSLRTESLWCGHWAYVLRPRLPIMTTLRVCGLLFALFLCPLLCPPIQSSGPSHQMSSFVSNIQKITFGAILPKTSLITLQRQYYKVLIDNRCHHCRWVIFRSHSKNICNQYN